MILCFSIILKLSGALFGLGQLNIRTKMVLASNILDSKGNNNDARRVQFFVSETKI